MVLSKAWNSISADMKKPKVHTGKCESSYLTIYFDSQKGNFRIKCNENLLKLIFLFYCIEINIFYY